MTLRSVQRPFNGLDSMKPTLSVAGSDYPITCKNYSRSNRGTQGCHITSCDVMFNAEILHHGRSIISAQFEQDQPPEYALTNVSTNIMRGDNGEVLIELLYRLGKNVSNSRAYLP